MTSDAQIAARAEQLLGPVQDWRLLSDTNSRVWRASADSGDWVVKLLTDPTSDAELERDLLAALDARHVRRISSIEVLENGHRLVVMPFAEGELLADRLAASPPDPETGVSWARRLLDLVHHVAELAPDGPGFGRRRHGVAPPHARWSDFLAAYLEEQRRKGPRVAVLAHPRLAARLGDLAPILDERCPQPRVLPGDLNGRNVLVRGSDERLLLLNLPVVWQGDPASAVGELLLHTDETAIADALLDAQWPPWLLHFYAAYHAFVICAYVERFSPESFATAPPWGRRRPLLDLLAWHLDRAGRHA